MQDYVAIAGYVVIHVLPVLHENGFVQLTQHISMCYVSVCSPV